MQVAIDSPRTPGEVAQQQSAALVAHEAPVVLPAHSRVLLVHLEGRVHLGGVEEGVDGGGICLGRPALWPERLGQISTLVGRVGGVGRVAIGYGERC